MATLDPREAYDCSGDEYERDPQPQVLLEVDVAHGQRLVVALSARIDDLERRVEALEQRAA